MMDRSPVGASAPIGLSPCPDAARAGIRPSHFLSHPNFVILENSAHIRTVYSRGGRVVGHFDLGPDVTLTSGLEPARSTDAQRTIVRKKRRTFGSAWDYWTFAASVKGDNRFVHTPEVRRFLATVAATAGRRALELPEGTVIRRAQLGGHKEPRFKADRVGWVVGPFRAERMTPIHGLAHEGRVNPAGIAYLYAANNVNTAVAEVRPWIDAWISLGTFRLVRAIRVVDCTKGHRKMVLHLEEPPPAERERCVWRDINEAFARPVSTDESRTDYVPTQVLGELFKSKGYDGVVYRSSCASGRNLVVFNTYLAHMERCNLLQVESLRYRHAFTGSVYTPDEAATPSVPSTA
jgi:RES domain-containing protein